MRGLLQKTLRELWVSTLLIGLGLAGANMLLTFLIPKVQMQLGDVFERLPFAQTMMSALLGTEVGKELTARAMASVLWVHPIVLALVWTQAINLSTRVPAGEVDRGTIDFLLGLPVSRRLVYACEVVMLLATGVLVIAMGFAGHRAMAPVMPADMRPDLQSSLIIMANFYCLYLAVGGVGFLVSALCSHRGRAVAIVLALVLGSFLLNFAAQLWPPAQRVAFLGVLEYYRPALVLQSGEVPWSDMLVLLAIAAFALIAGGEVMARRSLCTT
ncbi:ABC transporter permease [Aeoliella sp. ICT_H6.2]|uniref:ABC transporter permease n=1 Tax=Aeoliella straminimaris TaxID=2954799 RepID=A0A9X2JKP5_9BACT|nr:ABC transporter permease subunit [Aeoliella straminimaris]MCO6047039.1 ABC transporter permease [Aeoliella straminimaris]